MNKTTILFLSNTFECLIAKHQNFFEQPIIKLFLQQPANRASFLAALENPTSPYVNELNDKFEFFYYRTRIQKYLCSLIHFYSIDYDKRERKHRERYLSILDKPASEFENGTSLLELLDYDLDMDNWNYSFELSSILSDEDLIIAIRKLTHKQGVVLSLYFINGYTNKEIAAYFKETPQNISNIRKQAIHKIRQNYRKRTLNRKEDKYCG